MVLYISVMNRFSRRFLLRPAAGRPEVDPVFFGTELDSVDHVGIYMGENQFINATTSQGVKYLSLDESFWRQKYLFAKRLDLRDPEAGAGTVAGPYVSGGLP